MQTTSERQLAIREARRLLELDLVIFDTETTGLGPDAEIVEIAALKVDGTVLLDTLVKPRQFIPPDATAVHGITDEDAAGFPPIEAVLPHISGRDQHLASYNFAFDERLIRQCLDAAAPPPVPGICRWSGPTASWRCTPAITGPGATTTRATPCRVWATPWPNAGLSSRANRTGP